jgi:hypothetical protein
MNRIPGSLRTRFSPIELQLSTLASRLADAAESADTNDKRATVEAIDREYHEIRQDFLGWTRRSVSPFEREAVLQRIESAIERLEA